MTKVVALVGRPNVGKSTLFNRLTKTRDALVADFPGLTRDRKYGRAMYQDHEYILIDTGGIDGSEEGIETHMAEQSLLAIDEADLVLFLVDAKFGISAGDYMIADYVRKQQKKVTVVANKVDGMDPDVAIGEFYALGLSGEIYPIAAEHGRGVGILLDEVLAPVLNEDSEKPRFEPGPFDDPEALEWEKGFDFLDNVPVDKEAGGFNWYEWKQRHKTGQEDASVTAGDNAGVSPEDRDSGDEEVPFADLPVKFAIVGRPNVGKSTLTNRMLGEDRVVVYDQPGTTRDSIYTRFNKFGKDFYLVDTTGIRKKAIVTEDQEYYSVVRSIRAIENSDVCILMIDATRGIEAQDLNIYSLIQKNKKGLVVCINKWDLIESKTNADIKAYEAAIRERIAPFTDFPIIFTSALTKQRIFKVVETAIQVYENKNKKVPTAQLNEKFLPLIENYPPPAWKGKYIKIKYCTQLPNTQIPTFVFFANLPQYVKEPYRRFLENKLREWWDFTGTPVQLFIRAK